MAKSFNFKISSALKDIVGKDLITDDYVAIFELVKNAFDAHATKVTITFENINSETEKIIISDNGKGMNLTDLTSKWLFLAYSAKKDGTEDQNFDYRSRIYSNKPFAGAKGIGRFSCDKLGRYLYLETKKLEKNSNAYFLKTNWEDFEKNSKKEFIKIPVVLQKIKKGKYNIKNGTVLEISGLRSKWDRPKLLKLKDSLSKLINPQLERGRQKFSIILNVPEEVAEDRKESEYRNKINGAVKNFIFETLGLKTTCVVSSIKSNRLPIKTILFDGGTKIYEIKQKNNFKLLNDINITLYYLSTSAKISFSKRMGLASRLYGNVFLYKNGFRIYPYGEPFSDPMGIDSRKSRKTKSRLGTGEIIGKVEISGTKNSELKEASSRGDGLIKNDISEELKDFFFEVLAKLEKYVVDVQEWGLSIEDNDNFSVSSRVMELLSAITNTENIIDFKVPDNFLEILEVSQADSAESVVNNLHKFADELGDKKLLRFVEKAKSKVRILHKAREQAEKDTEMALQLAEETTVKLKSETTENLFLRSINTSDYKEMISLLHHIGIYAGTIENNLRHISLRVQNKLPLTNSELYNIIKKISLNVKKILSVSTFATKARFNLDAETTTINLIHYIKEYIQNIIPGITDRGMNIKFFDLTKSDFIIKTKPIEISIIIDNLVSNAKKAKAKNLIIKTLKDHEKELIIEFEDDGVGINPKVLNKIYNLGFTTTDGSGVGLYHIKEIVSRLKGKITVSNNTTKGVTFRITIKENL